MSSYSEGQTHQLMEVLQKENYTSDDVTKLGQSKDLPRILAVLRGRAKIVDIESGALENEFFKLISPEALIIGPTDGSEILADANDVFTSIDSDFRKWKADEPGAPTGETPVDVREMIKNATFAQMFGSLSANVSRLCLTQAQIKGFVKQHRDWLRTGGNATFFLATFFLFKSYSQFFVAVVIFYSDGRLQVNVNRFRNASVWNAETRLRLVVPAAGLTP